MKYFELVDVLRAVIVSFFYGAVFGGVYSSYNAITDGVCRFFLLPLSVLSASGISEMQREDEKKGKRRFKARQNASDFVFFLILGFSYILMTYILLDGIFRVYVLLLFLIGFFLSRKTLGALFEKVFKFLFDIAYKLSFVAFYVLVFPLKQFFKKVIMPFCVILLNIKQKSKSKKMLIKKIRRIKKSKFDPEFILFDT